MSSFRDRVVATGLPLDSIIVIASGVLDALGIRTSDDVDLAVSKDLFVGLAERGWSEHVSDWGETFYRKGDCEAWAGWRDAGELHPTYEDLLADSVEIDGVRYMSLDYVYNWKQKKGREKDIRDLELIDDYRTRNA